MTIKYIQEQLGVVADGLWGNVSHTALVQALRQGKVIKALTTTVRKRATG